MLAGFDYKLMAQVGNAKAGLLTTPHGVIETPVFMPVGTRATVKALSPDDLHDLGAQIILGNTYHLYLKPGHELVQQFGGLHGFMRWEKPILTDSGGYQVSSLGMFKKDGQKLTKITEEGAAFKSHIDGSDHFISPEKAIEIQEALGADIIMAFDEATPELDREYCRASMERTHRWLIRCINHWEVLEQRKLKTQNSKLKVSSQALLGIIQGGEYEDLRRESAQFVVAQDLPGIAIGGATIGQHPEQTELNVSWVRDLLPKHKPLYLMGVGTGPIAAIEAIKTGGDMFDCVAPTKFARMGLLYSGRLDIPNGEVQQATFIPEFGQEKLNIGWSQFVDDPRPISEACDCYTCRKGFSRAYLRHLFKMRELLFYRLATIHNVWTMIETVKRMRGAILEVRGESRGVVDGGLS